MLYEVITVAAHGLGDAVSEDQVVGHGLATVITSYSIHYTKLYEILLFSLVFSTILLDIEGVTN